MNFNCFIEAVERKRPDESESCIFKKSGLIIQKKEKENRSCFLCKGRKKEREISIVFTLSIISLFSFFFSYFSFSFLKQYFLLNFRLHFGLC